MKAFRKASRGQVWFLVDPNCPREFENSLQGKNRPWLIISNDSCNQNSPILTVVPLTTQNKTHLPTHVHFNDGKQDQTILCEQIRSIPEQLLFNNGSYYKYTLSQETMQDVDQALAIQLDITLCFPNAERFWKSLEQTIRFKVEQAVANARVSPVDISKLSRVMDNHLNELIADATKPKITIASEVVDNTEDDIAKSIPIKPIEFTPEGINVRENPIPTQQKRDYQRFTIEEKKAFVDMYYKHGYQYTAKHYHMSPQKAMKNYSRFKKELNDGTTGQAQD